jgi:phospholipid/cholesterol/gamma-HCH transport system substrate-binding protein
VQLNNEVPPCTKGYLPNSRWRPATDLSDKPVYPAKCLEGPPKNMRGTKYAPSFGSSSSGGKSYRVSPYDTRTGQVDAGNGKSVVVGTGGKMQTVFGDDSWKWMLTGPVAGGE